MKKYLFIVLLSLSFAQRIDSVDVAMEELRTVVETASRNGQRVLVDDFTGLTCPYCGYASFAVSDMLDEFPGTLISAQWHLDAYTPEDSDLDDCIYNNEIGGCFEARGDFYGWDSIYAIPIEVFNGVGLIVGATSEEWAYDNYVPIYQSLVDTDTPYEISINGYKVGNSVNYSITVTMDADLAMQDQKVHIFVVEDNIMSLWWIFGDIYHNARNVVRHWIVNEDLTINSSGESQNFSGSFMFDEDAWDPDNVKIIAMVQNDDNSEIFQVQEVNVNDMCDDNIWVPGNINGEVNTDQTFTVDVFDVLSLADIVASGDQGNCAYGISDITDDGNVNLLDVITLAMMIIEGSI